MERASAVPEHGLSSEDAKEQIVKTVEVLIIV